MAAFAALGVSLGPNDRGNADAQRFKVIGYSGLGGSDKQLSNLDKFVLSAATLFPPSKGGSLLGSVRRYAGQNCPT